MKDLKIEREEFIDEVENKSVEELIAMHNRAQMMVEEVEIALALRRPQMATSLTVVDEILSHRPTFEVVEAK